MGEPTKINEPLIKSEGQYETPIIPASVPMSEAGTEDKQALTKLQDELGASPAGEAALKISSPQKVSLPGVDEIPSKVHPSSTGLIDFAKAKKDKELAQKHFNKEDLDPSDIPPHESIAQKMGKLIDFVTFKNNKTTAETLSPTIIPDAPSANIAPPIDLAAVRSERDNQQNQTDTTTEGVPDAA